MLNRFILVLVTLVAGLGHALAQSPQTSDAPKQAAPAAQTLDLGPDIDKVLRWLRYNAQDRQTGSYGSVEATAWVLRVMVESPRKYRRSDGPFVERAIDYLLARQRADGAIVDEGARAPDEVSRQTRLAAGALALHVDASNKNELAKALAFVGSKPDAPVDPGWGDAALPAAKEEVAARVAQLLAKRDAEGVWDGPKGRVLETAQAVAALNRAQPILKPAPATPASAAKALPSFSAVDRTRALEALNKGARFLAAQADKGRFGAPGKPDAGLTAMAIGALECVPKPRAKEIQDTIDAGLAWLLSLQKPDGAIHDGKVANYTTSASIMALVRAEKPEYKDAITRARDYIIGLQADEGTGYSADDPHYGGIGYGSSERPDLSNLQMALDALASSGLDKDHEAFQRALTFLQRCQNRSESNDIALVDGSETIVSGDDGGAAYLPGQSMAGFDKLNDGKKVPRSYGSMTYALLKGLIFAGLPKDDERMRAAWDWLRKNYTLDVNPGFQTSSDPVAAYQGLFYYFHTMAKALDLYGEEQVVDAQNVAHPWRAELCGRIVALQRREDGSWINENSPRWYEGNPILATSYALLTLDEALPHAQ